MRLAIIDDHELMCEGLRALIESVCEVSPVYSGASPSAAMAQHPDVALLDIDLGPGSPDVVESTRAFLEAGVHVLLISAYEQASDIRRALQQGALGFIPKRVGVEQLREAIDAVADGRMYLSVDLAAILASAPEAPGLSPRERDALRWYASGLKLSAVAHRMGISPHTAKEYLDRVRAKYEAVGRTARTRTELYAEAQRDGLIPRP